MSAKWSKLSSDILSQVKNLYTLQKSDYALSTTSKNETLMPLNLDSILEIDEPQWRHGTVLEAQTSYRRIRSHERKSNGNFRLANSLTLERSFPWILPGCLKISNSCIYFCFPQSIVRNRKNQSSPGRTLYKKMLKVVLIRTHSQKKIPVMRNCIAVSMRIASSTWIMLNGLVYVYNIPDPLPYGEKSNKQYDV